MASKERKGDNQKLKMLYLTKIFSEETDEQHGLEMPEIILRLESYGVNADRKTLYMDFEELRHFGLDIISEKSGRNTFYYLASRDFELPELKLLVDSVQSAKFITDKKSNELIKKLESLVSKYEAKQLQRQVVISGRIKAMNESIYYNVDKLHEAISADRQIRFLYYRWNIKKEMELRKNGAKYAVSPWGLMWDDENYYLVGYDSEDLKIKHYRVDKMLKIDVVQEKREGKEAFRQFDMPKYSKSLFGMFGGEERTVALLIRKDLVGVAIDRFGKDIAIIPYDEEHFKTMVNVAVSPQFFGWVMSFGTGIRVISPEDVVEKLKEEIRQLSEVY
ncbi:MAG: WYL domain-containing protein [Lachnospiraceae bacterium]|nr:WYL domain-containing protein [Lachnospiraceae bacterium]